MILSRIRRAIISTTLTSRDLQINEALKKTKNAIAIGLIITFLAIGLINPQNKLLQENISKIEGIIYDLRLNATLPDTPRKSSHNIFIVDIDEKALEEVGRWPWSRATISRMVEQLKEAGVVVVGFDVVFSEPEINPVDTLIDADALNHLSKSKLAELRLKLDADTQFAQTIADYDVVLGGLLQHDKSVDVGTLKPSPIVMLDPKAVRISSMHFAGKVANVEVLQEAAISQGFFNSVPDVDGAIRRAALVFEHNGVLYPSLSIEIARVYELADEVFVETKPSEGFEGAHDISAIKFGTKRRIKTDSFGRVLIPYRGGQKSFPYYSATDILHGRIAPELLEGGVALVGTSAVGIADLRKPQSVFNTQGLKYTPMWLRVCLIPSCLSTVRYFGKVP
ncbi:CHASE2 domain-containing protein [Psychrosphaera algicola]|uniref:CHASE2 domain-containing protein n=1 Tax=Psychrosphaera algicola TaxID=3023714 RepID=A0ABT5FGG3_9GAMM|nr:CHASE2 domain-containing protein [Psychrosphaera sp. G1-22]MDC2890098.1 CHASE2 domain-containing protein [Psychrosphaera sp. G1-22]